MRIGYFFNGYLADTKLDKDGREVSTPDGNATYTWSIVDAALKRRWSVVPLYRQLDRYAAETMGADMFSAFSKDKRARAYAHLMSTGWLSRSDMKFPRVDVVLLEWRFPIPGRNTEADKGKPWYSDDLERQNDILREYSFRGIPIVIWDLDHRFTQTDADMLSDAGIWFRVIETAVHPKPWATRVEPPFVISDLLQFDIDERMPAHTLGYIGSRYERDESVDHWLAPHVRGKDPRGSHAIKLWGKWEPHDEVRARWPGIGFGERIGVSGFRRAYSRTAAVPLLAKQSYYDSGFVTPRIWEAILFGSVPIGLAPHRGIGQYVEEIASSPGELWERAQRLRQISPLRRRIIREEAAHRLRFMDSRNFLDVIEGLLASGGEGVDGGRAATTTAEATEERKD